MELVVGLSEKDSRFIHTDEQLELWKEPETNERKLGIKKLYLAFDHVKMSRKWVGSVMKKNDMYYFFDNSCSYDSVYTTKMIGYLIDPSYYDLLDQIIR